MKIIKFIFLSMILILFIINIDIVITSVSDASILFITKVFVTIFPFIILSDILIYYDYHIFLNKIFGNLFSKLFNISKNSTIIIILSLLSSQPCNSIYIKNMLENKSIDEKEANKVLNYTYFPSIAFVIGTIGISLYNSFKIGLYLLLNNYLCNILIGIYLRKEKNYYNYLLDKTNDKNTLFSVIKSSIIKSVNTSFLILGNIILFTIITNLLNEYINIIPIVNNLLTSLLEMTSGIINISSLNISMNIKLCITSFILNFSGLSILFQSLSILSNININIKKTLIIKLVFSFFTSLLFLLHNNVFYSI